MSIHGLGVTAEKSLTSSPILRNNIAQTIKNTIVAMAMHMLLSAIPLYRVARRPAP